MDVGIVFSSLLLPFPYPLFAGAIRSRVRYGYHHVVSAVSLFCASILNLIGVSIKIRCLYRTPRAIKAKLEWRYVLTVLKHI
jgi:hypothetical protein